MIRTLIVSTVLLGGLSANAGYVPPPDSPYWCYEACIDPYYTNHNECVAKCYESKQCEDRQSKSEEVHPMAAVCCSWGDNISGCMPGC